MNCEEYEPDGMDLVELELYFGTADAEPDDRTDVIFDAKGDAYTQMALGYPVRDAIDNIRVQYALTDDECDLIYDKLTGC